MIDDRELAALDPVAWLRRTPPFDVLGDEAFAAAARALRIGLFAAGTRLVARGGAPLRALYVVRRGAARLEREGRILRVFEEGEVFGYASLVSGEATLDVVIEDDLLAYLVPAPVVERLLREARFAAHLAMGLSDRVKASLDAWRVPGFEPDVGVPVERLVRRAPVWMPADATVEAVARAMREASASSVLLRSDPPAIVTDRDLRNRVLAEDLGPELPAAAVCSRPLRTVAASAPVYEAWRVLLDAGVNHLPLERDGEIVGVLGASDLLRHSARGPLALLRRIERLGSRDALPEHRRHVAEMASSLLDAGLDAVAIAGFVAQLDATLLRRLLQLAEAELGPPPAPYAWLVFGSEGRRERILPTDQDGVLVHADDGGDAARWSRALAARVGADLEAAGHAPCPAGRMPSRWQASLAAFARERDASVAARPWEAGIWLDMRRAAGTLEVDAAGPILAAARRDPRLVRAVVKNALGFAPPTTVLLRLHGTGRLDLKKWGLSPIVFLARGFALEAGSAATGTLARLADARAAGLVPDELHAAAAEAFRFLLGLRLQTQLRAIAAGAPPTDTVAHADLTALERARLKEALRAIAALQESAAHRWQAGWA